MLNWADQLIDQLIQGGVTQFFLSPGSRSTPLVLALAKTNAEITVHFDERGMGFCALGAAKATQKPSVLIVTSGTAVGNLMPCVMEAHSSAIPLILLTADRPQTLRHSGCNQTIEQPNLFSPFVRFQIDVQLVDENPHFLRSVCAHALLQAVQNTPGPVHINCMIQKPTKPRALAPFPFATQQIFTNKREPDLSPVDSLINQAKKPLILLGQNSNISPNLILEFAEKLNIPILTDILSGVRQQSDTIIPYFDLLFENKQLLPDLILQIGERFVSKHLFEWIQKNKISPHVLITTKNLPYDPVHSLTHRVECTSDHFCKNPSRLTSKDPSFLKSWQEASDLDFSPLVANDSLDAEAHLFHHLPNILPENWALFIANSTPIRHADLLMYPKSPLAIFANRGVSGIDGNIATCAGISKGIKKPLLAILGDLTCLHDLNSLALLSTCKHPVVLLILNNSGGGIFSFLLEDTPVREKYFNTTHPFTFQHAAEQFHIPYARANSLSKLEPLLKSTQSKIIEITTDSSKTTQFYKKLKHHFQLCSQLPC